MICSTRKVNSAYTGACCRIRRSSDSAEQDLYFNKQSIVDETVFNTFVGGGTAFIKIMYDQSGNGNNYQQLTTTNQPTLVFTSNIPEIQFNSGDQDRHFISINTSATMGLNSGTYAFTFIIDVTATNNQVLFGTTTIEEYETNINENTRISIFNGIAPYDFILPSPLLSAGYRVITSMVYPGFANLRYEGTTPTPMAAVSPSISDISMTWGLRGNSVFDYQNKMSEMIIWNTTPSDALLLAIETDQIALWNTATPLAIDDYFYTGKITNDKLVSAYTDATELVSKDYVDTNPGVFEFDKGGGATNMTAGVNAGAVLAGGSGNLLIGENTGSKNISGNSTVYIGLNAGQFSTGSGNTAMGHLAFTGVDGATSGTGTTAIGYQSSNSQTIGQYNTSIGYQAGVNITSGSNNTCVGRISGDTITTGSTNTCIGMNADCVGTLGGQTAIGYNAVCSVANEFVMGDTFMTQIRSGSDNLCDFGDATHRFKDIYMTGGIIGSISAFDTTKGSGGANYISGTNSGTNFTTAAACITIGTNTLSTATTSSNCIGIGHQALRYFTGVKNIGIGDGILGNAAGAAGDNNTAIGSTSLAVLNGGNNNLCCGAFAGSLITTGSDNTCIGYNAQVAATSTNCSAIGAQTSVTGSNTIVLGNAAVTRIRPMGNGVCSLGEGTFQFSDLFMSGGIVGSPSAFDATPGGANNMIAGSGAGAALTTGSHSMFVGVNAGSAMTNSSFDIYIGFQAGEHGVGSQNVALGVNAYQGTTGLTTGGENVCVGQSAGQVMTSSSNNTCIGHSAGNSITSGGNNTAIGNDSDCAATLVNQTALGYLAVSTASNEVVLGNTSITSFKCQVALTVTSDERDKADITPLTTSVLPFITNITPCSWVWKMRGVDETDEITKGSGFTAQNIKQVALENGLDIPDLINDINPDRLGISETKLIPLLVKAIQELEARLAILEKK